MIWICLAGIVVGAVLASVIYEDGLRHRDEIITALQRENESLKSRLNDVV